MDLILENVRSFRGRHVVPLKPLTFLVGSNSAGKTSFLSIIASVFNQKFPSRNLFNTPPYDLGTFDTIATNSGGRWRAEFFSIGFQDQKRGKTRTVEARFVDNYGQPKLSTYKAETKTGRLEIHIDKDKVSGELNLSHKRYENKPITFEQNVKLPSEIDLSLSWIFRSIFENRIQKHTDTNTEALMSAAFDILHILTSAPETKAVSIAPVRSKPKRTYDELLEDFNPEGNHIPLILARAWENSDAESKAELEQAIVNFGLDSGLFSGIKIKKLGKRPSDPFQLHVKEKGPSRNLTDVGYGVSQSLPVVVESILCSSSETMLLQQPEVHLHPKAQAALGTFLSELVSKQNKSFVVETHSDYMIDRVRQEVAKNTIPSESVSILYFDKRGSDTNVYPIEIDNNGNLLNSPPQYRAFFLEEEMNLLLRGSK